MEVPRRAWSEQIIQTMLVGGVGARRGGDQGGQDGDALMERLRQL